MEIILCKFGGKIFCLALNIIFTTFRLLDPEVKKKIDIKPTLHIFLKPFSVVSKAVIQCNYKLSSRLQRRKSDVFRVFMIHIPSLRFDNLDLIILIWSFQLKCSLLRTPKKIVHHQCKHLYYPQLNTSYQIKYNGSSIHLTKVQTIHLISLIHYIYRFTKSQDFDQSSIYYCHLQKNISDTPPMSLLYNITRLGPRIDPCGTPRLILDISDIAWSTFTNCFLSAT